MTNIKVLVILLIVFLVAVSIQKNYSKNIKSESENSDKIISPSVSPILTSIPTFIPTVTPKILPTSIPMLPPVKTNINSFIYPNSVKINIDASSVILQSSDDPQVITNWYKEKITNMGMNTKSFVQTNTNGNVLNKLVAANSDFKVSVTVSKKNNQSSVEIAVSIN